MASNTTDNEKLLFIMYEDTNFPRYYEVKKKTFKFLIYGVPVIILLILSLLFASGAYIKNIKIGLQNADPSSIKKLERENKKLSTRTLSLQETNKELTEKIRIADQEQAVAKIPPEVITAQAQSSNVKNLTGLPFFIPVAGQKSLVDKKYLNVEKVSLIKQGTNITLSFNLVNNTEQKVRLAGFIHIVMKLGDRVEIWPTGSLQSTAMQAKFSSGESFATSIFRPVNATFQIGVDVKKNPRVTFWVIAHNLKGDLIHKQILNKKIRNEHRTN